MSFSKVLALCLFLMSFYLTGCTSDNTTSSTEKVFHFGTTAYGIEMGNTGLNPHHDYSGWSAVRYGVGETLFKFNDKMQLEPWLAKSYEQLDDYTVKITLKDNIKFSSGRALDGQAVKECLEDLIKNHDRAPFDLKIASITADGQDIIIKSQEKVPALLNYLSDPYGAIIDMQYGITADNNVAGTGPFVATKVSDKQIELVKNPNYWNGNVAMDKVIITEVIDGDTLTMALQTGEFDAVQGLPYANLDLFQNNPDYHVSSIATSRCFFAQINYNNPILQDYNIRKAIAMSLDKQGFTHNLLQDNGSIAIGAFPDNFTFGGDKLQTVNYNPIEAKELLAQAGWVDNDGDGYVDKDGKNLEMDFIFYSGRAELPLFAEATQSDAKKVGIKVNLKNVDYNVLDGIGVRGEYDLLISNILTLQAGDPEVFINQYWKTNVNGNNPQNGSGYSNPAYDALSDKLAVEFDPAKRRQLVIDMQKIILDDAATIIFGYPQTNMISNTSIANAEILPCDYYWLTKEIKPAQK